MTRLAAAAAGLLLLASTAAFAQTDTQAPAHLSLVEGEAVIERGTEVEPASTNLVLVAGDRLRTDQGRVELLLGDGSALHVDERSTVDLNSPQVFRLLEGRLIVLADQAAAGSLQIDTRAASVRILSEGEYRLSIFGDGQQTGLDVAVVRGEAEVAAAGGSTQVYTGTMVSVREGEAPTWPARFNSAEADAFVAWSEALTDSRRGSRSAEYLPDELQPYSATMDRYGSWSYAEPYGYVWYPSVATTWRPYWKGRWRWTIGIGWVWVGGDPWSWPTHHFGRWGFTATGRWFWIPARVWGPAWVHWAVSPGFIGWCPLGWNNRPVLAFFGHHHHRRFRHSPWHAWSVVRTNHFRSGAWVHHSVVPARTFEGPRAPRFAVQASPPNVAVARRTLAARGPGETSIAPRAGHSRRGPTIGVDRAVPRGGASRTVTTLQGRADGTAASPDTGRSRARLRTPEAGAASRAPSVIYHRGEPRDPAASRDPATSRSGDGRRIAVPRGGSTAAVREAEGGTSAAEDAASVFRGRSRRGSLPPPQATPSPGMRRSEPASRGGSLGRGSSGRSSDSGAAPSAAPARQSPSSGRSAAPRGRSAPSGGGAIGSAPSRSGGRAVPRGASFESGRPASREALRGASAPRRSTSQFRSAPSSDSRAFHRSSGTSRPRFEVAPAAPSRGMRGPSRSGSSRSAPAFRSDPPASHAAPARFRDSGRIAPAVRSAPSGSSRAVRGDGGRGGSAPAMQSAPSRRGSGDGARSAPSGRSSGHAVPRSRGRPR